MKCRHKVPFILLSILFPFIVTSCDLGMSGLTGAGSEAGAYCRETAEGIVKVLILDGDGFYTTMEVNPSTDDTEVKIIRSAYEIVKEDGEWFWVSYYGSGKYANQIESFIPEELLVLYDNMNDRSIYYYYFSEYQGNFSDNAELRRQYQTGLIEHCCPCNGGDS